VAVHAKALGLRPDPSTSGSLGRSARRMRLTVGAINLAGCAV
jgi:hypothetical protein